METLERNLGNFVEAFIFLLFFFFGPCVQKNSFVSRQWLKLDKLRPQIALLCMFQSLSHF